jgi:hypothetical protein
MLGPNTAQGLNERGATVADGLNAYRVLGIVVASTELQEVLVIAVGDGQVAARAITVPAFNPAATTHHIDDCDGGS